MSEALHVSLHRRSVALLVATALFALTSACGDSGQGSPSTVPIETSTNRIIHHDAPEVQRKGTFEPFNGYLSESAYALRSLPSGESATVRFELGAPEPGFYELFAWWPQTGTAGSQARVRIEHAGGETVSTVDQSTLGGQWNSLGVFELRNGSSAIVFEQVDGTPMVVDSVRAFRVGAERPALALSTVQLSLGEVDQEYRDRMEARGGTVPYAFRLLDEGALPVGLVLDESGVVSGRPAYPGSYTFSVEVRDGAGTVFVADVSIDVLVSSDQMPVLPSGGSPDGPALKSAGTSLVAIIADMPEGSWKRVNQNNFSDVWVPAALRPLFGWGNPTPAKVIGAWSSFAWDSTRGNLLLYGGGHANYRGNEVYLWRGSTQRWERASLPSESRQDTLGNWNAVDGADNAPASAHTYDNTVYLPMLDRVLFLGGAADANGGHYMRANDSQTASRKTGPYLFDPNRAHPNRVGGTTGSHVQRVAPYPDVVGGNMWSNRETWLNPSQPSKNAFVDGCTAYAEEDGKDNVYVYVKTSKLYRYRLNDLARPGLDTWQVVGRYWGGPGNKTSCGYDPVGKSFVRVATNTTPFVFWDLNRAGTTNDDVRMKPTDPTGQFDDFLVNGGVNIRDCGLDFDLKRRTYMLWCGGSTVWKLTPPPTLSSSGWAIGKASSPSGAVPDGAVGAGILGKWKYARDLDAFVALQDSVAGNVWIYKPIGWQNPGDGGSPPPPNVYPQVAITAPIAGTTVIEGDAIAIAASASDTDGAVAEVEFFVDGASIGSVEAEPFSISWQSAGIGLHTLTAIAVDDRGAHTTSSPITVNVGSSGGGGGGGGSAAEIVLQRGVDGYEFVEDTYLSTYHKTSSFGSSSLLQDQSNNYSGLVRFAIFESEGGPVYNGATIESATLSLYRYTAYDMTYAAHRVMKPWRELGSNWTQTGVGGVWAVGGANGAGSDFDATPDATASISFSSGQWIHFDVTEGVRTFGNGVAPNFGWRLKAVKGYTPGLKRFYTSNYVSDPQFRPKLTIRYR